MLGAKASHVMTTVEHFFSDEDLFEVTFSVDAEMPTNFLHDAGDLPIKGRRFPISEDFSHFKNGGQDALLRTRVKLERNNLREDDYPDDYFSTDSDV